MTNPPLYRCWMGLSTTGTNLEADQCTAENGAPTQAGFHPGSFEVVVALIGEGGSPVTYTCPQGVTLSYNGAGLHVSAQPPVTAHAG